MSSPFRRSLPARPDLAQQKKQAKELLKSFTAGDAESRASVRAMLWNSWQTFRIDQVYAILVVIAAIGIGLAALIRWMTYRSAPCADRETGRTVAAS